MCLKCASHRIAERTYSNRLAWTLFDLSCGILVFAAARFASRAMIHRIRLLPSQMIEVTRNTMFGNAGKSMVISHKDIEPVKNFASSLAQRHVRFKVNSLALPLMLSDQGQVHEGILLNRVLSGSLKAAK